jgi:hypothetical protein
MSSHKVEKNFVVLLLVQGQVVHLVHRLKYPKSSSGSDLSDVGETPKHFHEVGLKSSRMPSSFGASGVQGGFHLQGFTSLSNFAQQPFLCPLLQHEHSLVVKIKRMISRTL